MQIRYLITCQMIHMKSWCGSNHTTVIGTTVAVVVTSIRRAVTVSVRTMSKSVTAVATVRCGMGHLETITDLMIHQDQQARTVQMEGFANAIDNRLLREVLPDTGHLQN